MSEREKELFLFDILVAVEKIKDITKNYDNADDLVFSYRDWDSVIREFEIIGEAMKNCIDYGVFEEDKNKRKVVDFRNILIHKYFGIDPEAVLNIAKDNINWLEDIIINRIKKIKKDKRYEIIDYIIDENHYLSFIVKKLENLKNESE